MTVHALSVIARSTLLFALAPAALLGAQSTTAAARITGDYVLQDKGDGMPHTIRVTRIGATYSVQWDANTPTTLVSRGVGNFLIAADTNTRVAFSGERGAARTLLMISPPSDTARAVRVAPMRRGTSFDGDDWAGARGGALFDSLSVADSLLFDAFFVRCDAEATIAMYTVDAEFYHDRDGLKVGAAAMDAFRNNCPRDRGVRRAIVPGTVRVFGIAGYGAVQLGRHRFIQSDGARAAARVLVLSDRGRVLLLEAQHSSGHRWWLAPGGGLDPGETFASAAQRELHEEAGLMIPVGQWVWTRRHVFMWEGRRHDQYERYFVATTEESPLNPAKSDSYVVGHRWWTLDEIQRS